MDIKKIFIIILIVVIVGATAFLLTTTNHTTQKNVTATNNTTYTVKNTTNITNESVEEEPVEYTSSESSHESDPEFGTDEYVQKWDESQNGDGSWAYTHDQPVKSEGGHEYKRMYNPDTHESYWYQMR